MNHPGGSKTRELTRKEWYLKQVCRKSADSFRELAQILHMAGDPLHDKSVEEIEEDTLSKIRASLNKAMEDLGDVVALLKSNSVVNMLLRQNEEDKNNQTIQEQA
ncbi:MAG: hypothetical protein LUD72_07905 [Bacteroidales bacterium]|nr:hypothetical protein [Bacteroidales bacterium]